MKLINALYALQQLGQPVLRTNDASACLKIQPRYASKVLSRLEASGQLIRIGWGLWVFPDKVDPLSLPTYLTAPSPSYISLQSALYYHGMISQLPVTIYAVSLARTRRLSTPLGTVSIHHLQPNFFFGFEQYQGISMATPEKALLDILYLRPAKSRLFCALPELEFPAQFQIQKAKDMIQRIDSVGRRTLVSKAFDELCSV